MFKISDIKDIDFDELEFINTNMNTIQNKTKMDFMDITKRLNEEHDFLRRLNDE